MSSKITIQQHERIVAASHEWRLDPGFLRSIVEAESNGDPFAIRYEPLYRYLWNPRTNKPVRVPGTDAPEDFKGPGYISKMTEVIGQKTSWGPMQVMGAVVREYGFNRYFPELCSYGLGIHYGCKHLYNLRMRFRLRDEQLMELATAYNTGSPKDESHIYWKKVKRNMENGSDTRR